MTIEKADVYFKDGQLVAQGDLGTFAQIGAAIPPPGPAPSPLPDPLGDWTNAPMLWKSKGTSEHPQIENGKLKGRVYFDGRLTILQIFLEPGSLTKFGASTPYWYFQPQDDDLMPNLEDGQTMEAVGSVVAWYGGDRLHAGSCWWSSGPGGSRKYGIRSAFRGEEFGPGAPDSFGDGDRIRLEIAYELRGVTNE